jgi:hypothetical protein
MLFFRSYRENYGIVDVNNPVSVEIAWNSQGYATVN